VSLFAAVAFYFSTTLTLRDLDHTREIASALLRGDLGLREKPPEWLNEMVPYGEKCYSAFPLGAVFSMVPIALLQKVVLIHNFSRRDPDGWLPVRPQKRRARCQKVTRRALPRRPPIRYILP
jgi:hypothetical protein